MIEAQYLLTASVAGQSLDVWDKWSGGDKTTSSPKARPGGMGDEQVFAGLGTYADGKLSRVFLFERDQELFRDLRATRAGRSAMTVTRQPLDANGQAYGKPDVFSGQLKSVTYPNADGTSETVGYGEIDMVVTSVA